MSSEQHGSRFDRPLTEEEMDAIIAVIRSSPKREPDPAWTAVVAFYELAGLDIESEDEEVREYLENEKFWLDYRIPFDQDEKIRKEIRDRRYIKRAMLDSWFNIGPTVKQEEDE